MSYKKSLVTTTEKIVKEVINDMETKPHVVKEDITHYIEKNNIDTVNKTEKQQASKGKKCKSISNKLDKVQSLHKSRSTKKNKIEETVK